MKCYYYLHTNGCLIHKNEFDEGFRDSPFVVMWWCIDSDSRTSAWNFLVEALSLRMKNEITLKRVYELATGWECDNDDAKIYAEAIGVVLEKDGNAWCAHTVNNFIDIQSSPCGFGDDCLSALADLCRCVGYHYSRLHWGNTFCQLISHLNKYALEKKEGE